MTMTMIPSRLVEIISVGNELLTGHTLNTNAHWIAARVTEIGGTVRRVTVVRDEIDDIASSIRGSLGRKAGWLIISGGLGPTYDDRTLQGLAKALGRKKLVLDDKAVAMLRAKYSRSRIRKIGKELTAHRLKMATIPEGARPLENPAGHAPAVMIRHGPCTIFSLPGVPKEMTVIFTTHIQPLMKRRMGKLVRIEATLESRGVVESVLAPHIERAAARNPRVYIKSHPRGYRGGVPTLRINIACLVASRKSARKLVEKAVSEMEESIVDAGGTVRRSESIR